MTEFECDYFLVNGKAIPRFGTLLRQVCDSVGIKQPLLEKYGQAEYAAMQRSGRIVSVDVPPSSMLQQVISLVVNGKQKPSYLQTLIWIKVIKAHYNNEQVKDYFYKKGLEMPVFTQALEDALWALSGHQPLEIVEKAVEAFSDFNYVPHRLPRSVAVAPETEPHLQKAAPSKEPHTGPLDVTTVREI